MAILTRPAMIIEGAFRTVAATGDRIWANLSDYAELGESAVSIVQRRQTVFDERSPGTLSFTLNNNGGEFTDTNTGSVFYPGVTQNCPLRTRIQYPATANLLPGNVSRTDDVNGWEAQQGGLDTSTTSPAAGVSSSVVWTTGVLDTTGIKVAIDTGDWVNPGDTPIYVKAGQPYSARVALKASAAVISCSLHLAWYDRQGTYISEVASSTVALTTSFQTLSITNAIAPQNGTLRISIQNETIVPPAARAISYSGGMSVTRQWMKVVNLQTPDTTLIGDFAEVWIRLSDNSATVATPSGWAAVNNWSDARGRTYLFTKIMTSFDADKVVAWTASKKCRMLGFMCTYSGVNQSTPLHKNVEATETVKRTTHTTPNVTTTVANCWIQSAAFDESTTNTTWGAPGGENVRLTDFCTKGNACTGIITDNGTAVAVGTYGTKAMTTAAAGSSRFATMHTLALLPITGTGAGTVDVFIGAPMVVQASSLPAFVQAGDWKNLIVAYADSWAPHWSLNNALVDVIGTDRMKLLTPITLSSAISNTALDSDPIAYYKLDASGDLATTTLGDTSVNAQPPLSPVKMGTGAGAGGNDPVQFGSGIGPGVDGTAALILNPASSTNGYMMTAERLKVPLGGNVPGISVMLFFASTQGGTAELTIFKACPRSKSNITRTLFEFYGKPGNYIGVKSQVTTDGTVMSISTQSAASYFDGSTHMLAATLQFTGGQAVLNLYIDGALANTATVATPITNVKDMNTITIGNAYPAFTRLCAGTYSDLVLYNSVLTDDDIAAGYNAGTTAFAGDSVTDRLNRQMDWVDLTGSLFDSSDILVDRYMPDDTSLLDDLRLTIATDGGTLYVDGDDNIVFRSSATKEAAFTPTLTISAKDLAVQPTAIQNDVILVNDVTINRLGAGNSQRLTDTVSIAAYGAHQKSVDTLAYNDLDALALAGYYIAFYSEPKTRFESISIEMLLQADLTNVMALDMWSIVRVTELPPTAPSVTLDSFVEGFEYSIGTDSWLLTLDTSYAIPFAVIDDAVRGIMGNNVVAL